jgi:hypothetical protein
MELHVDSQMFHRMRKASLETYPPDDPAVAAWNVAGVGPYPIGAEVEVKVTLPFDPAFPKGRAEIKHLNLGHRISTAD